MKTVGPPYSGKLNEGVGWEGDGETYCVKASEALCLRHPQITDRLLATEALCVF